MSEELRQVRDALIEELRRSDRLTVAARSLFNRYMVMSADDGPPPPSAEQAPEPPPARRRRPADEDEDFGGSFMVRSNPSQPNIPGYHERSREPEQPPVDLPRSMRDRRR